MCFSPSRSRIFSTWGKVEAGCSFHGVNTFIHGCRKCCQLGGCAEGAGVGVQLMGTSKQPVRSDCCPYDQTKGHIERPSGEVLQGPLLSHGPQ